MMSPYLTISASTPNKSTPAQLAGRTMRMMREAHGLNLRQFGGVANISPSHLSRVERGERAAGTELTDRICSALAALPPASLTEAAKA